MNVSECSLVNWIVVSYIYSWVLMTLFVNFVEHTHSRHEPHYSPQSLVIQCAEEPSYLPHSIAQCIYIKNKIYIGLFSQKSVLMFFVSIWQCYHHTCTSVLHITHEWARYELATKTPGQEVIFDARWAAGPPPAVKEEALTPPAERPLPLLPVRHMPNQINS